MMKRYFQLLLLLTFVSCEDKNVVFEENKEISGAVWKVNQPAHFEFEVQDTLALYNFYVNMRNKENYPFSNVFVFIEMEFPNGKKSVDTVECYLADTQGKWLGSGLGDIYDNRFLYQQSKQFPLQGRYKIDIIQGMRVTDLEGICDVGFRLSKK
jgi:gliding motility-associated lipoprotein GldH